MIETQTNLVATSSFGAASVATAGGSQGTASVAAVAVNITDVLVTSLDPAGLAGLLGLDHGRRAPTTRPRRSRHPAGYAATATYRPTVPAPKTGTKSTSAPKSSQAQSSKTSGPLGFLNDPKMSVEDKLFKFMCYVADKYDKAIEKKMNEIAGKQDGSSASGASGSSKAGGGGAAGGILGGGGGGGLLGGIVGGSSGGGGLLGGILGGGGGGGLLGGILGGGEGGGGLLGGVLGGAGGGGLGGALGSIFPAAGIAMNLLGDPGIQSLVTQLSGPVLAAGASCLGFPEFAPLLLKAGPELAQGAFGALEAATGGGGASGTSGGSGAKSTGSSSSSKSTGSSGSSGSSSTDGEPKIEQKDMLELQRLQDKQKEMFSLVSNMLRSMHDTKMAVINNLRT